MMTQPSTLLQAPLPNATTGISQARSSLQGQVTLNFEELTVFDRVADQYRGVGVRFEAAIAISPSNPTFTRHTGAIVLMSTNNQAEIIAHFRQPIRQIEAAVCCTSSVMMAAYNANDEVLEQISTEVPQYIKQAGDLPDALPLQPLGLNRNPIHKAIFYSDAPFILDMLYFEF